MITKNKIFFLRGNCISRLSILTTTMFTYPSLSYFCGSEVSGIVSHIEEKGRYFSQKLLSFKGLKVDYLIYKTFYVQNLNFF